MPPVLDGPSPRYFWSACPSGRGLGLRLMMSASTSCSHGERLLLTLSWLFNIWTGLYAERSREGDRSSEDHSESPREEAASSYVSLCAHLQPQNQRPGQGHEQFTHLTEFR